IDELGRITIPMEIRRTLGIETKDSLEIYTEGEKIILSKHTPTCVFCKSIENLINFRDKSICSSCLTTLTHNS
ncbi:MAG: AbrB/MazE/SpoVT family DNA-binding domain-containing protein, partial [Candidatus Subteraquimicrobiales bacterium]|nr:AbrB/MazE/SpoVT family DNA-binding domain-containing protein [Candidatus Subteraquimicrobiales bacterium]